MITADPNTYLGYVCQKVDAMQPGDNLSIPLYDLQREIMGDVGVLELFCAIPIGSAADRVLENIVGSSYTHSYTIDEISRSVVFKRHTETGQQYHTSPDWIERLR